MHVMKAECVKSEMQLNVFSYIPAALCFVLVIFVLNFFYGYECYDRDLFNSPAEPCFPINAATNVVNIPFGLLVTASQAYLVDFV